jgi:hypothetical protein
MNDIVTLALPVPTFCRLLQYVDAHPSAANAGEIAAMAIEAWLAGSEAHNTSPLRHHGYQWKTVFWPEGTHLRVWNRTGYAYAEVIGDAIVYLGEPVSPHAFICRCKGISRSAWMEVALLFPGEDRWKRADALRSDLHKRPAAPATPAPTAAAPQRAMTLAGFSTVLPPISAPEKPLAGGSRLPRVLPIPTQAHHASPSQILTTAKQEMLAADRRQGYRRREDLLRE